MQKLRGKSNPSELEKIKDKCKVVEENWKRALADYQNLERRIEKQKHHYVKLANLSLIEKLLTILDDLEKAAIHLNNEGLDLIVSKLQELLKSEGVQELETEGKEFDPSTMECVEIVKGKSNHVVKVQKKGYILNEHIIRPAKVEVGDTK